MGTPLMPAKPTALIRTERHRTPPPPGLLYAGALWPKNGQNLGTLARTCDALNATLVVPADANASKAVRNGNTIGVSNTHILRVQGDVLSAITGFRDRYRGGVEIVGCELAAGAIPLKDVSAATVPTLLLIGHENRGVPDEALALCDYVVEIPMNGVGNSLNVTVAASLVLYKLRGWA